MKKSGIRLAPSLATALAAIALMAAEPASARSSGIDPNGQPGIVQFFADLFAALYGDTTIGIDPNGKP